MTSTSLERILKLLHEGLYSGCIALIVGTENHHQVLVLLEKLGSQLYNRMQVMNLDFETATKLSSETFDGDLLLIDGLSRIGPIAKRPTCCVHILISEKIVQGKRSLF